MGFAAMNCKTEVSPCTPPNVQIRFGKNLLHSQDSEYRAQIFIIMHHVLSIFKTKYEIVQFLLMKGLCISSYTLSLRIDVPPNLPAYRNYAQRQSLFWEHAIIKIWHIFQYQHTDIHIHSELYDSIVCLCKASILYNTNHHEITE